MKRIRTLLLGLGVIMSPAVAQVVSPGMTAPQDSSGQQLLHPATGASAGMGSEAEGQDPSGRMTSGRTSPTESFAMYPQPQAQGDITFLCGGVGTEEEAYMKRAASDYDLMLTFAARDGSYLANIDVELRDASNNPVLQADCDGPLMLVDLPRSGTYSVQAETEGRTLQHRVRVTDAEGKAPPSSVVLSWPTSVLRSSGDDMMSGSGASGESGAFGKETKERAQDERTK